MDDHYGYCEVEVTRGTWSLVDDRLTFTKADGIDPFILIRLIMGEAKMEKAAAPVGMYCFDFILSCYSLLTTDR